MKYEVESDVSGVCTITKYNTEQEALIGAQTISLLADEARVYFVGNRLVAKFVKGKRVHVPTSVELNHEDKEDILDPEVYGSLVDSMKKIFFAHAYPKLTNTNGRRRRR